MTTLRFRGVRGVRYALTPALIELLRQYRQRARQPEMGGLLAGWQHRRCLGQAWVVTHLSLPISAHRAGRTWFQLDRAEAQRFIDDLWHAYRGKIYLCGYWHTHPEPFPRRSRNDEHVIHDLFHNSPQLELTTQLGLIVGNTGQLYAWCQRDDGRIYEQTPASRC